MVRETVRLLSASFCFSFRRRRRRRRSPPTRIVDAREIDKTV